MFFFGRGVENIRLVVHSGNDEEVMLPCEFCEHLLPSSQLAFHQVSYTGYINSFSHMTLSYELFILHI